MRLATTALLALAFACRYPHADVRFGLDKDEDGIGAEVDCDDLDADVGESITFFTDADGDGVGTDDGPTTEACEPPDGFGEGTDDCDDGDDGRFPGNAEVADDDVDQDCSGTDTVTCFVDADEDGWGSSTEVLAADGSCDEADGEVTNDDDCNDGDDTRFPGANEIVGDGIDQNCDGLDTSPCYTDADGDGFGNPLAAVTSGDCTGPNLSTNGSDCKDTHATVKPGGDEVCDGFPSDCADWTSTTVPGVPPATEVDDDDDGYVECDFAAGITAVNWGNVETTPVVGDLDCEDDYATVYPTAPEACDGFPSDCDDWTDAVTPGARPANEIDDDGDGFVECAFAAGITAVNWGNVETPAVTGGGDCDDARLTVFPSAPEICDGRVNTCGGALPVNEIDDDNDAFVECAFASGVNAGNWGNIESPAVTGGGDCADAVARTFPGAPEFCDELDNDCDDSLTDENGRVSFESTGGTWTDQTPTSVRQVYTLSTSGTVWFCRGTYKVRGNISAASMSLIGRYGAADTVISGADAGGAPNERMVDLLTSAPGTPALHIEGLTFVDGTTSSNGGAVRLQKAADLTVTDVVFRDNLADFGGALYITGGTADVSAATFETNEGLTHGGAVYMLAGTLDIADSTVEGNQADHGAGIYVVAGSMTVDNTNFAGNDATNTGTGNDATTVSEGGAIRFGGAGTLTIVGGTFTDNTVDTTVAAGSSNNNHVATATGGAVHFSGGTLDIDGATFTLNAVTSSVADNNEPTTGNAWGGAVYVAGGIATIDGGSFDGNFVVAVALDAGASSFPVAAGGGLYVGSGNVAIGGTTPVTFTANEAGNVGGGLYVHNGTVTVTGSTIELNLSDGVSGQGGGGVAIVDGTLALSNTDVVGNNAVSNDGGGILAIDDGDTDNAVITLSAGSTVDGNDAADWGGGIACHGECTIALTDSFVSNNSSVEGGGVHLSDLDSSVTCTATTANLAGVTGNAASGPSSNAAVGLGGGVQMHSTGTTVTSTLCNWGAGATAENNTPADIGYNTSTAGGADTKNYGTGASFVCTYGSAGCIP